jgi:DNA-directed RNA polymerase subunit RPC12/RpoP
MPPVALPHSSKSGYLVAMSSADKDGDRDACPNCGARVESSISGPSEQLREATERRCPSCGRVLRRDIGGVWSIDETAK